MRSKPKRAWFRFRSICRDGLEDPLDDAGLVQQQLDQLSTIGRCEYEKTCALLVQLFDQAAQSYQELLQSTNSNAVDITVQEGTSLRAQPEIEPIHRSKF